MRGSNVLDVLQARLCLFGLLAGACRYCFGSCTSLLAVLLALLFGIYITWEAITIRAPSSPILKPVPDPPGEGLEPSRVVGQLADPGDEMTKMSQKLDELQGLLESHGEWADKIGIAFLKSLEQIHRQQRDQLRQHDELRKEYEEKLSSVVNVLDDHQNENAEAARAAAENTTALCDTIGQHRQDIDNNHTAVQEYMHSVNTILIGQEQTTESVRQQVVQFSDAFQTKLDGHARTAEDNSRLVEEHGASINRAVSNHAQLVAEYQVALDGMVALNTSNRVFSLVHISHGWETLGDIPEDVEGSHHTGGRTGPLSGAEPMTMVENVQALSRTFRAPPNKTAQATPETIDQMMAALSSKIQDTVQDTLKAQHNEETRQLRRAQEDIEKLRADLGDIQEFRRLIRRLVQNREELERHERWAADIGARRSEILQAMRDDPERIQRDPGFRAEVDEVVREGERAAADATASSSPGKA